MSSACCPVSPCPLLAAVESELRATALRWWDPGYGLFRDEANARLASIDNDAVAVWQSRSEVNNGYLLSPGDVTNLPHRINSSLANRPVVRFDGVNNHLRAVLPELADARSVHVLVRKVTTPTSPSRVAVAFGSVNTATLAYANSSDVSTSWAYYATNMGAVVSLGGNVLTWTRLCWSFDAAGGCTVYRDGLQVAQFAADMAVLASKEFNLGRNGANQYAGDFEFGDVLVFNGEADAVRRDKVDGYIKFKYQL